MLPRFYPGLVETLDDPDPRPEERLMHRDADGPDPTLREVAGRLPEAYTKSSMKSWVHQTRGEFRVLKRMHSPRPIPCGTSASGLIEVGSWISITRARPFVASRGVLSIPSPPHTKCSGESMCVPVCDPSESVETLATSPCSMSSIRSIRTGGLFGQWTIPLRSGTEMSTHPSSLVVRGTPAHTE